MMEEVVAIATALVVVDVTDDAEKFLRSIFFFFFDFAFEENE